MNQMSEADVARHCMGAPPKPPKPAVKDGTQTRAGRARCCLLIVEDNYFIGLATENALNDAGYSVLGVVDSGEEALKRAGDARPHLVLMDIRLAGDMDGIAAAIALRKQGITCLMASAHSDEAIKRRCSQAHPAGWLVKPFSDADVVAAVDAALLPPDHH